MEFKDKLKRLRRERSLSQQALADAIFISRSAVAKWENGLGLPSADSLQALANYFDVSPDYFTTDEPEQIIVEKNKTIYGFRRSFATAIMVLVILLIYLVSWLLPAEHFAFSSQAAVGVTNNAPCIQTENYDFYLFGTNLIVGEGDSKIQFLAVTNFLAVEQVGFLYRPVRVSCTRQAVMVNGSPFMTLVSLPGEGGWHNFLLRNYAGVVSNLSIVVYDTVTANGSQVPVLENCYFFTEQPVEMLILGDTPVELGPPVESTE